MAVTLTDAEPRPRWPRPGVIDPARCYVSYHPPADELVVSFGGTPVPKYVNPIEAPEADDLGIMVGMNDDESSTGEVVGLLVMPLLVGAVRRHPGWAAIALGRSIRLRRRPGVPGGAHRLPC